MKWLLLILPVILFLYTLVRITYVAAPAAALDFMVRGLLKQGYHGGLLTIQVPCSRKFLQIAKYIDGPGNYGLELVFPRAGWSERFYPALRELCDSQRIPYRITTGDPFEFLVADFGKDAHSAHEFLQTVFRDVLGVPANRRLWCRLTNATPYDVQVG